MEGGANFKKKWRGTLFISSPSLPFDAQLLPWFSYNRRERESRLLDFWTCQNGLEGKEESRERKRGGRRRNPLEREKGKKFEGGSEAEWINISLDFLRTGRERGGFYAPPCSPLAHLIIDRHSQRATAAGYERGKVVDVFPRAKKKEKQASGISSCILIRKNRTVIPFVIEVVRHWPKRKTGGGGGGGGKEDGKRKKGLVAALALAAAKRKKEKKDLAKKKKKPKQKELITS